MMADIAIATSFVFHFLAKLLSQQLFNIVMGLKRVNRNKVEIILSLSII